MTQFDIGPTIPFTMTDEANLLEPELSVPGFEPVEQPAQESPFSILDLDDAIGFIPRGVEGFFQSIYQLGDQLFNDGRTTWWDERFLGRSDSAVGGLAEGMVQFLTGFMPVAGILSRGAQFGNVSRLTAGATSRVAGRAFGDRARKKVLAAMLKNRKVPPSLRKRIATDIAAGTVADFTAFEGHDARLSNFIKDDLGLQTAVTDFLAANEGDTELEGRLKNVLEGGGLGIFSDAFIHGLGALGKMLRAKLKGVEGDALDAVGREGVERDRLINGIEKGLDDLEVKGLESLPPDQRPPTARFGTEVPPETSSAVQLQGRITKAQDDVAKLTVKMEEAKTDLERVKIEKRLGQAQTRLNSALDNARRLQRDDDLRRARSETIEAQLAGSKTLFKKKVKGQARVYQEELGGQVFRVKRLERERVWVNADDETDVLTRRDGTKAEAANKLIRRVATQEEAALLVDTPRESFNTQDVIRSIRRFKEVESTGGLSINPRTGESRPGFGQIKMTPLQVAKAGIKANNINLARLATDDRAIGSAVRAVEQTILEAMPKDVDARTIRSFDDEWTKKAADLLNDEMPVASLTRKELETAGDPMMAKAEASLAMARRVTAEKGAWILMMEAQAEQWVKASGNYEAARGTGGEAVLRAKAEFAVEQARFTATIRAVTGLKSISGRDLVSLKGPFVGFERVMQVIKQRTGKGDDGIDELSKLVSAAGAKGNLASVADLARRAEKSPTPFKALQEFWINSILGGGRTLVVNVLSNAVMSLYRPFERMMGRALAHGDPGMREMALDYTRLVQSFRTALDTGWESGRAGEARFFEGGKVTEFGRQKNFVPEAFGTTDKTVGGRLITHLGKIRYAGAVLTGGDEFAKSLNFHVDADHLLRKIHMEGGKEPDVAVEMASKKLSQLVHKGQVINEEVLYTKNLEEIQASEAHKFPDFDSQKAEAAARAKAQWDPEISILDRLVTSHGMADAREATFTTPIPREGTHLEGFTKRIQDAIDYAPIARFSVPFIQTPFNIFTWARDRTVDPLWGMAKRWLLNTDFERAIQKAKKGELDPNVKADLLTKTKNRYLRAMLGDIDLQGVDPLSEAGRATLELAREDALGRLATGMGAISTFVMFAELGLLTGRGPEDKEQRGLLQAAGWQPYSFKIGDAYIEYRRFDPFATLLGTVADVYTISQYLPKEDQDDVFSVLVSGIVGGIANNATNKTYMTGLSSLLKMLTNPVDEWDRFAPRFLASFVPSGPFALASTLLAGGQDPYMRELRDFTDAAMTKLIPYHGSFDPQRNFLGEEVRRLKSLGAHEDIPVISQIANMFVPAAYSEVSDDFIMQEIAALQHAFTPPDVVRAGVDLRDFTTDRGQSAYDRMLQLRKDMQIGGRTLRQSLRDLIRSNSYQVMDPVSTSEVQSPRITAINSMIGRYDRAASREMRREFPDVAAESLRVRQENMRAKFAALQESVR